MSAAWYGQIYPGTALTLGADGFVPAGKITGDDCCAQPLTPSFCTTACSMIGLLPSGPLWDTAKARAIEAIQRTGDIAFCDIPVCPEPEKCPTMADYAIYAAMVYVENVNSILWPAIREASPATAVSTVDDWLSRYAWSDCYKNACGRPDTPFNFPGECGITFCNPVYPTDFDAALKHGILQALVRAKKGVIKNLAGLNWIVAPLGAAVRPVQPWPDDVQDYLDNGCDDAPCPCGALLEVYPASDTLLAAPGPFSNRTAPADPVAAIQCDVAALPVYPGVIAADCVLRSIVTKCPNVIRACYYGA